MTRSQVTTSEAANRAHVTPRTIRTWCARGLITARKSGARWLIDARSLGRRLRAAFRQPTDRPRPGQHRPLSGRAARRAQDRRQARAVALEYQTRVIGHHTRARIAAANDGYILARDYLAWLGLDEEFIAKYESAFGRAVAKTYRATHGTDPQHGGRVILRGRVWHTMRYSDIEDLHAGARAYKRTARLFDLAA